MHPTVKQHLDDAAAVVSAGTGGGSVAALLHDLEPYVAIIAGVIAIVSGAFAIWYHYEKARWIRRRRRREEEDEE